MVFKLTNDGIEVLQSQIDTISINALTDNFTPIENMIASASYQESYHSPQNAVDEDYWSRWASNGDPSAPNGYLELDFGNTYKVNKIYIRWEAAYALEYKIQMLTLPNTEFVDIVTISKINVSSDSILIDNVIGNKLRIQGVTMATQYAMSIYDVEVYGVLHVEETQSSQITKLISWQLLSGLIPTIDTTKVDFTTSTLITDSVDETNIQARYDADVRIGTPSYEYVNGKTGLKFDSGFSTLVGYNPNKPQIADELFDKDTSEKIWTGDIDIHSTSHTFSCCVYPVSFDETSAEFQNPYTSGAFEGNKIVSLYASHIVHYLEIDKNGRPALMYYAGGSPGYRYYVMDTQLQLNTWHNIVWTFTPSSSNPDTHWRIKGYVDGICYGSYLNVGTTYAIHYLAISPDDDVENFHYDARDVPGYSSQTYLAFGVQFSDGAGQNTHTLYLKDVSFYSGAMSDTQVNEHYNEFISTTSNLISNNVTTNNFKHVTKVMDSTYNGVDYYNTLTNGDVVWSEDNPWNTSAEQRTVANLFDNQTSAWNQGWHTNIDDPIATFIYKFNSGPKTVSAIKFTQGSVYLSKGLTISYGADGLNDNFTSANITSYPLDLAGLNANGSRTITIEPITTELLKVEVTPHTGVRFTGLWEVEINGYEPIIQTTSSQNNNEYDNNSQNLINIDSKFFAVDIVFSNENPLPSYDVYPYVLTINNNMANENDQIIVNVKTNISTVTAIPFCINEGNFKIAVSNYNTLTSFTETLTLNVYILT